MSCYDGTKYFIPSPRICEMWFLPKIGHIHITVKSFRRKNFNSQKGTPRSKDLFFFSILDLIFRVFFGHFKIFQELTVKTMTSQDLPKEIHKKFQFSLT